MKKGRMKIIMRIIVVVLCLICINCEVRKDARYREIDARVCVDRCVSRCSERMKSGISTEDQWGDNVNVANGRGGELFKEIYRHCRNIAKINSCYINIRHSLYRDLTRSDVIWGYELLARDIYNEKQSNRIK